MITLRSFRLFLTDRTPSLVLWFFDSRGGFSLGANSSAVPDWVDSTVADWIVSESTAMNAAWGPATGRGALAFVHIPPWVLANEYVGPFWTDRFSTDISFNHFNQI